ncbi:hypothetical protein GCM10025298_09510 [Natronobiforma cellulositropha]
MAGAVVLGSATAASATVTASEIELYDTVEVTPSSTMTFRQCCTADISCQSDWRRGGERGTVVEQCSPNGSDTFFGVLWFDSDPSQDPVSYVDEANIEPVS